MKIHIGRAPTRIDPFSFPVWARGRCALRAISACATGRAAAAAVAEPALPGPGLSALRSLHYSGPVVSGAAARHFPALTPGWNHFIAAAKDHHAACSAIFQTTAAKARTLGWLPVAATHGTMARLEEPRKRSTADILRGS